MLEPTAPLSTVPRGAGYLGGYPELISLLPFTALWDATGFPVVSLPAAIGPRSGMPVGVSLIAPPRAEAVAVQAAVDLQERALTPPVLADALSLPAPYHAFGLRQDGDVWSVAAKRVEVVEVPERVDGDELQLVVTDERRSLLVDNLPSSVSIPSLEAFGEEQFGSFVLRASRLDDLLWEVTVIPL